MSYIAIIIYLASAALNTWSFDRSLQKARQGLVAKPSYPFQTSPKPLRFFYMFWWTTVAAFREPLHLPLFYQVQHTESPAQHQWSQSYSGRSSQRETPLTPAITVR